MLDAYQSSNLSSDSLLLIVRILRNKLNVLKEIQNLLDKQKIKSLPEKVEIDEDISLYGDNTESSNDLDDRTSHNEDIDQDDPSSDDYNQENEQPPSDDDQNSEDNSLESNEPEKSDDEIPPPTKPKQSGSQDDAIDTTSNDHNPNTGNSDHNWHEHNANRGSQSKAGGNRGGGSNWQGGNTSRTRSKSTRNSVSPNNRMPVYVGKEKELDKERTEEEREHAKKIGDKGEKYVLDHSKEYLFSDSNRFIKADTNNKGYDITEVDSNGEIVRYIEIKTLTGKWGEGGVGITESQLEFAQDNDDWWLFVVENINTENTQIHVLENPVLQANRFMFDHSWKQLAVETKGAKNINPQVGDKYRLPDGVYEILSVKPQGKLIKVKLKHILLNKKEVTKKFDPSWEKC